MASNISNNNNNHNYNNNNNNNHNNNNNNNNNNHNNNHNNNNNNNNNNHNNNNNNKSNNNLIPETKVFPSRQNNENNRSLNPSELRAALQRVAAKPNGLLVGNQLIKRVSGPASVTLLKPPANPPFHMPPIIFFGDIHWSIHGECEECDGRDGCYRISKGSFYQVFDRVATKEAPIDVYVEYFMKDMPYHQPFQTLGELARTREYIRKCAAWDKTEEKRYSTPSCPTQNIRYQYGDPRASDPSHVSGTIFEYILDYLHISPDKTKKLILESSDPLTQHIGKPMIDAFETFNGFTQYGKYINPMIYADQMYNLLLNVSPQDSRIAKQLQKMPNGFNKKWIEELIYDSIIEIKDEWYLNNWMADVYTLLRLFKTPKGGPSPALAIMYFGDYHRRVIVNFLIKRLGYEAIYSDNIMEEKKPKSNKRNLTARCIIFNKHIPLNDLFHNPVLSKGKRRRHRSRKSGQSLGITLDQVEGPIKDYENYTFYVFHLPRNNKRVMTVDKVIVDDHHYKKFSNDEQEEYISLFPVQTLVLYYDPTTKQHRIFYRDYRTDDPNIHFTIYSKHILPFKKMKDQPYIYDFNMMMVQNMEHSYYIQMNDEDNNEDSKNEDDTEYVPFGEGSDQGIHRIIFTLTLAAVRQIRKMIMDHPSTPRDALIYRQDGGGRRAKKSVTRKKLKSISYKK